MIYIGIDPGAGGGIAQVSESGHYVSACRMPATDSDILSALSQLAGGGRAILERVRSSPQMGVVSAFTFGRGYGALRMALAASGIPYDEVNPAVWQRTMGCLTKGDKNVSKRRAQELFPEVRVTHAISDALLLAEFARRVFLPVIAR